MTVLSRQAYVEEVAGVCYLSFLVMYETRLNIARSFLCLPYSFFTICLCVSQLRLSIPSSFFFSYNIRPNTTL